MPCTNCASVGAWKGCIHLVFSTAILWEDNAICSQHQVTTVHILEYKNINSFIKNLKRFRNVRKSIEISVDISVL